MKIMMQLKHIRVNVTYLLHNKYEVIRDYIVKKFQRVFRQKFIYSDWG